MSSCIDNVVEGGVEVAWHDWGPSGTRLLQYKHTPLWPARVSGSRVAVLCDAAGWDAEEVLFVFDVHPSVNLGADLAAPHDPANLGGWDDVTRSKFIESPGPRNADRKDSVLKEVVHTSFPCKVTHRKLRKGRQGWCSGLILTEDALALVVRHATFLYFRAEGFRC